MSRRHGGREDRFEVGAGQPAPRNLWLRRDLLTSSWVPAVLVRCPLNLD